MKKILLLNYEFPPLGGGASPVSYEIAKKLSESGEFDIDVVTMGYKGLDSYEEVNKNLKIHRVKCWRTKKEICHPWEQLTYLFSAYFKCKKLIKKNKYDICHCHFIIPTGVLALRLKKKFDLPYIITVHGSDVLGYNPRFKLIYPLIKKSWKKILDNAKNIISPSQFLLEKIKKQYRDKNNAFKIIPNGIDTSCFIPMKKEKYILIVSRLFINKGIQDFLKAIREADLQGWRVKIVGDGPCKEELIELTKQYNLTKSVDFLGWVDNKTEQMKQLYGKATVFVLPSHFENWNNTILEAMSAGCAIIATKNSGTPEILKDTGILVEPKDIKSLGSVLKKLLENENLQKELGKKADNRIRNMFDWNIVINEYAEILNEFNIREIKRELNIESPAIRPIKSTGASDIFEISSVDKKYILKMGKYNSINEEFENHKRVYNIWIKNKVGINFFIPKPYFFNKEANYYVMEYVDKAGNLQDMILEQSPIKLENYFKKVGKMLYQYQELMTKYLNSEKHSILGHNTIQSILSSSKEKFYSKIFNKIDGGNNKIIFKDFKPANILIDKFGKLYLIDFQKIFYWAPFYYDLARFIDAVKVFTFFKSPFFYLYNRKKIHRLIIFFIKGYSQNQKIDFDILQKTHKLHQIEHVFMKKDKHQTISAWLLSLFYKLNI